MASRRVVLAAGGTGGHMFPAEALAGELTKRGWGVGLLTDERGASLANASAYEGMEIIDAASLNPSNPIASLMAMPKIARGMSTARRFLREGQPEVVVGFGGYPAFPALAAAKSQTPIIVHEQNAVLGRVNRQFATRAEVIASGFKRLERLPPQASGRWSITGNPVRQPIADAREVAYAPPQEDGPIRLLVIGGSLGARILSEVTPQAVARLPKDLRERIVVVQQAREENVEDAKRIYAGAGVEAEVAPFFTDIAKHLAQAHMVIARAGASTVTELGVVGRPSILVPLAIAMDDHQTLNAKALTDPGAADALDELSFDAGRVTALLQERLSNPVDLARRAAAARAAGRPDAAGALADLVEAAAYKAMAA